MIRNYGFRKDHPELKLGALHQPVGKSLPRNFNLMHLMPPVWNQGSLGSCFIGDTLIPCLDGKKYTIKEMYKNEGKYWVYSVDDKGDFIPAQATVHLTGNNKELLKITLDNKKEVICTPDHKFMLRDGSYLEASKLNVGQSLMPLKRFYLKNGYEMIIKNSTGEKITTHRCVRDHFDKRENAEHFVVHHINFNKNNNTPENLIYMEPSEHSKFHGKLSGFKGWNGTEKQREHSQQNALKMHREVPGWNKEACSRGGIACRENARRDLEVYARVTSGLNKGRTDPIAREKARLSRNLTYSTPEYKKKRSESSKKVIQKQREENSDAWQKRIELGKKLGGSNSIKNQSAIIGNEILFNNEIINDQSWNKYRKKHYPTYINALKHFETYDNLVEASENYNHKVSKIEKLDYKEDVYCLNVPGPSNFLLDAGVIVHNCTAFSLTAGVSVAQKNNWEPSQLFLYFNERKIQGSVNQDSGSTIGTGISALNEYGIVEESDWPYNIQDYTLKPGSNIYQKAKKDLLKDFRHCMNLQSIKECIFDKHPVSFGFQVYSYMESANMAATGVLRLPESNEKLLGGHAVAAIGWDDDIELMLIRNSWGPNWGQQGYFQMPYKYIEDINLASDFWSVEAMEIS